MMLRKIAIPFLMCLLMLAPAVRADVKTEEKTKIELPGVLGGFMKVFGGKSARDGVANKVALKGNRKMTVNEDTADLVDLSEEKFYHIDLKKKTYTVVTFEQMRKQMQDAMDKAKAEAAKSPAAPKPPQNPDGKEPEMAIDFKLQESGQTAKINGYDCREVVATVTVRQKDKKPEEGAMMVTSNMWLTTPRIAAVKELEEFDLKVAQKLYLPIAQSMAAEMAPAMGAYPGLKDALGKLEVEKVNMDGTAIRTVVHANFTGPTNTNDTAPAAKPAEEKKQTEIPKSLGGLLGGLGKKAATRNDDKPADKGVEKTGPVSFMTSTTELVSVSTTVSDADVAIPAGFKESK